MKITKELFKSFKGLEKLKTMEKTGYCNGINCKKCPLDNRNLNLNTSIDCADIIDLDGYAADNPKEMKKMNKVIDIFTEEKISKNLSWIDKRLKYNSKVIYNGNTYKIKGVLKKDLMKNNGNPILLNGFSNDYKSVYDDSICVIKKADTKKGYSLWVDIQDIEIK